MLAAPRVGVLEKRGAVEAVKAVRVPREVGGDPVHHDAEAVLVAAVHRHLDSSGVPYRDVIGMPVTW